jgi:hypothetical protein
MRERENERENERERMRERENGIAAVVGLRKDENLIKGDLPAALPLCRIFLCETHTHTHKHTHTHTHEIKEILINYAPANFASCCGKFISCVIATWAACNTRSEFYPANAIASFPQFASELFLVRLN